MAPKSIAPPAIIRRQIVELTSAWRVDVVTVFMTRFPQTAHAGFWQVAVTAACRFADALMTLAQVAGAGAPVARGSVTGRFTAGTTVTSYPKYST